MPDDLAARDGALIYLSLGSLGSADVDLMQRLVDVLARTTHRVIVSKGPLADQITLHDNQTGEGFLPQPAILPMVDLVITHGGNNTVTEAFHHGKPMIVLPLFWDQVDNAQRVDETGFGKRLSTYGFEEGADRRDRHAPGRPGAGGPSCLDVRTHQVDVRHGPCRRPDRAGRQGRGARHGLIAAIKARSSATALQSSHWNRPSRRRHAPCEPLDLHRQGLGTATTPRRSRAAAEGGVIGGSPPPPSVAPLSVVGAMAAAPTLRDGLHASGLG